LGRLVRDLGSPEYAVRRAAMERLASAGATAVGPLRSAAASRDPETAIRAAQILEHLFARGSAAVSVAAEEALEQVQAQARPDVSQMIDATFALNVEIRERRALVAIERLGGVVRYGQVADEIRPDPVTPDEAPTFINIPLDWKGQPEDLKLFHRLGRLRLLYVTQKAIGEGKYRRAVTEKQVAELQRAMPGLLISWRGPAYLGISPDGTGWVGAGCTLSRVQPGAPADLAGLRVRDVLTHFDGVDIRQPAKMSGKFGFERLVELIEYHEPGDKVPVIVERDGETLELTVALGDWK
jgi:hypothetical protein